MLIVDIFHFTPLYGLFEMVVAAWSGLQSGLMTVLPTLLLLLPVILVVAVLLIFWNILKKYPRAREDARRALEDSVAAMRGEQEARHKALLDELNRSVSAIRQEMTQSFAMLREETAQGAALLRDEMARNIAEQRKEAAQHSLDLRSEIGSTLATQQLQNEQKLENIRLTMEKRIGAMQDDNAKQLERMRQTVDEKLQETLNRRISDSFKTVQEQLLKVSEGLGEMQSLASDVGGLKNVLSNVKTKGILGEYQLAAILEEILSPEQYEENIATKANSRERVEFAIKLPGDGGGGGKPVYLPVDAKFPSTDYERLMAAYDEGDVSAIDAARKALAASVKQSAKTIHDKYVQPPGTTDFALMFLPTEGLYAEVVNLGLVRDLQNLYKINIAGPTTMAAFLNSLQMGFKTLAIQKRSSEVWNVLSDVKTEFTKFEDVLKSARKRILAADSDLDRLIGTRTNAINRKLRGVSVLSGAEQESFLIEESAGDGGGFDTDFDADADSFSGPVSGFGGTDE
jgi:DNA recombination protein RmuC